MSTLCMNLHYGQLAAKRHERLNCNRLQILKIILTEKLYILDIACLDTYIALHAHKYFYNKYSFHFVE